MDRDDLIQKLKSEAKRMHRLMATFKDAGPEAGIFERVAFTYEQMLEQLTNPKSA